MSTEEWTAAGLYDPTDERAAERAELLAWMHARGIAIEQMVAACADGQLSALAGDLALRPGSRLSIDDIAARTSLDAETIVALRQASGMPYADRHEPAYTEADIPMFESFAAANELFRRDELLHFTRVIGSSMRRIAEAAGEMFLRDVESEWSSGMTELERATAGLHAIDLAAQAPAVFEPMFRMHLALATEATRRARAGLGGDDFSSVTLTVGFVDLSGFTGRSTSLDPATLLQFVVQFESAAQNTINDHGGRLIKVIGDEVMFSAVDAESACRIARDLLTQLGGELGTGARGGLARGPMVAAGGDLYGDTVNLAARLTDIAIPGEVLVNGAVQQEAVGHDFEPAGRRQLKGFGAPVQVWSLGR